MAISRYDCAESVLQQSAEARGSVAVAGPGRVCACACMSNNSLRGT